MGRDSGLLRIPITLAMLYDRLMYSICPRTLVLPAADRARAMGRRCGQLYILKPDRDAHI